MGEQQFTEERAMPADPCAGELCHAPAHCLLGCRMWLHSAESPSLSLPAGADALITAHDFLSWIKQEEEPCVREPWELPEREMLTGPGPGPGEQCCGWAHGAGVQRGPTQAGLGLGYVPPLCLV